MYRHHNNHRHDSQHGLHQHGPHQHANHKRNDTRLDLGSPSLVEVTLLGGFAVSVDGIATSSRGWSRRSAAALVKILALAPGHRLHRERVMDLLWPDESPERSAPRLHKAAYFARRAAGRDDAVVLRDDVVWLFPEADITVDAVRFEQLAREAIAQRDPEIAKQALDWYGGELLPSDVYEDWAADRRELLHLRRLDVLRVIGEWRELAELDPTDEEAHVQLMQRHVAAGDGCAALAQYDHLERVLERELGVEPGEAARRARLDASRLDAVEARPARVDNLLAELAELADRQHAVLAQLAAVGATPRVPEPVRG
jgi:DNA-binding SARP family transcriptional activator